MVSLNSVLVPMPGELHWNGPITFNDRAWQGSMNQLYLINERILKDEGISLGGRVDLLYGTDFIYTTASWF